MPVFDGFYTIFSFFPQHISPSSISTFQDLFYHIFYIGKEKSMVFIIIFDKYHTLLYQLFQFLNISMINKSLHSDFFCAFNIFF